ncbi:MAG: M14 family zinc carboxypeptidase [Chloroflexota bacterium]
MSCTVEMIPKLAWPRVAIDRMAELVILSSLVTALWAGATLAQPTPATTDYENEWFAIGHSVQGRPIQAFRLGSGERRLALLGGIHGGWERNTYQLVSTAIEHFQLNPGEIPGNMSVFFIPGLNPDGLAAGNDRDAAWNARGVDLNRNFDTPNWSTDAAGRAGGRYGPSGRRPGAGGAAPFSEPESSALRDFVRTSGITAALSYHSGIVSVTARDGGGLGTPLARRVAIITGYPYLETWTEYELTGQLMDWLDAVGVRGVEIDLPDQQTLDWGQNLAAIRDVITVLAAE